MTRPKRSLLIAAAAGALLAGTLVVTNASTEVPGSPVAAPAPAKTTVREPEAARPPAKPSCDTVSAPWSTRQRLAQLLMIGVPGNVDGATKLVADHQVGGIFVHSNPTGLLVEGRLAKVRAAAKIPLTVAIDEEGGRVQTVDTIAGSIPSARQMAATMSVDQVKAKATDRGKFLSTAGITMNFAPVVDVSSKPANTVIGDRSFSGDPAVVKKYAAAFASGLSGAGVFPVLKHFPGHGGVDADSHKGTVVTADLSTLTGVDLVPYQDLADYGPVAVMVGHLVVPGLTDKEPATLSPAAYRLLREQYRFDGLVVTDDLGAMRAISSKYDLPDAVFRALAAGADTALWSSGARTAEVLDRLEAATKSGELSGERVRDALRHVMMNKGLC